MTNLLKIETGNGVTLRVDHYKISVGEFVDCREHRATVPTQNGFSIPIDKVPEFICALESAMAARKSGK